MYANRMAPTERTNVSYAMIFPSATIVKVVGAQIAARPARLRQGAL